MPPKRGGANSDATETAKVRRLENQVRELMDQNFHLQQQLQHTQYRDPIFRRSASPQQWKMTSAEAKDAIPKFYPGESVHMTAPIWTKTVDDLILFHGWQPQQAQHYAQTQLRGAAKNWYYANREKLTDWEKLKNGLLSAFPDTTTWASVQQEMIKRTLRREETLEEYAYDMQFMGHTIGMPERDIITAIISGLRNETVRNVVSSARCSNIPELIQQIKDVEAVELHNKARRAQNTKRSENSSSGKSEVSS